MSQALRLIQELVAHREVRISAHGYDELAVLMVFLLRIFWPVYRMQRWWKIIQTIPKGRVCWSYSGIRRASRSMSSGEFPGMRPHLPLW